jgi:uncharacterized protein
VRALRGGGLMGKAGRGGRVASLLLGAIATAHGVAGIAATPPVELLPAELGEGPALTQPLPPVEFNEAYPLDPDSGDPLLDAADGERADPDRVLLERLAQDATEAPPTAVDSELLGVQADAIGPPELLPAADPDSPAFIGPRQMAGFALLGTEVAPGTRARLEWSASQSFAGADVISPVVVVHGVRPGAVLCVTAAIHGDELNGVEIVRRLTRTIDPAALSGTVVAVPIVNLFGFGRNSRYLPDRRDLNRFFPGSPNGSIASRIAHSFFSQIVRHCDALVDIHTGSFDRSNLPQVRADLRLPEVLRFARGFGAVPVLHSAGSRGMLRVAASQARIPAVTFEVGAPAILQPEEISAGVRGIESLMHYLAMMADAPGEQEPQAIFYDSVWVRANAGGMLISSVALGQRVVPNQRLGVVIDPINDIEREIVSPLYGRVIGMARNQVVLPGFAAYHVGEETSEDRAVSEAAAGRVEPIEEEHEPPPENGRDPQDLREPRER